MRTRSTQHSYTFRHPFALSGVDEPLPSGRYWVITEEEPIQGLSFEPWLRARTLLLLPANSLPGMARQIVPIDPDELAAAFAADGQTVA